MLRSEFLLRFKILYEMLCVMKKRMIFTSLLLLLILCVSNVLFSQNELSHNYSLLIDSTKLKASISMLASDSFQGRKSGGEGLKLAENYLSDQLTSYKLSGGNKGQYLQSLNASFKDKSEKYFYLSNYNFSKSYKYNNDYSLDSVIAGEDFVFAGYGLYHSSRNDFVNVDIKNKVLILLKGDGPVNKFGVKKHNASQIPTEDYIVSQKPKAVFMIEPGYDELRNYQSKGIQFAVNKEGKSYPTVFINELLANKILEPVKKTVKQLLFEYESTDSVNSFEFKNKFTFNGENSYSDAGLNNVVGFIEGSDLRDEYIVLSAHYDHIGTNYKGVVYNGADDNASGVAAVLEIARLLKKAKSEKNGPRRSIIILLTASEEDGLKGAEYYVKNPLFPIKNTKLCINLDMIGRMGSEYQKEEKDYVLALTGKYQVNDSISRTIEKINKNASNISIPLYKSSFFGRSDQYVFDQAGVKSIMFTSGEHADLHETTDDTEKIDFRLLQERTKLVFLTLWEFANNKTPYVGF